ncbi:uncharacterized protein LOC128724051 [Anopheles nili]|uniref:uncharacterized protein LOC128724051 n=1 Tax=Anopheles nili TaxID=185578 RepID=UPI00237B1FA2|nr:uncharacterized protein LOC128724051 [Anopheles nili]
MPPTNGKKPTKLCRRTFFLQTGTAPTIAEIRSELGPDLADIIINTLEPSQRSAVQPERLVLAHGDIKPTGHDPETGREQIHEHILQLGGGISKRVDCYWRDRLRQVASAGASADEMSFLRFECQQKISIAREEERKRYDALLERLQLNLAQHFWEEKGDLHRSYAKARALWGEFVCRKVRKQAKDMLRKIAVHYRAELEREVEIRTQIEKDRISAEMERIVKAAVDQQKRVDERAIQWLFYQYEELFKFTSEYHECLQTVEMIRELCKLHSDQLECRSTQLSGHSLSFEQPIVEQSESSSSSVSLTDLKDGVVMPSCSLSKYNVFVVSQCLPEPECESIELERESVIESSAEESLEAISTSESEYTPSEDESARSSIEKIIIGGLTYAQPKYYTKVYNELFRDVVMSWQKTESTETADVPNDVCCDGGLSSSTTTASSEKSSSSTTLKSEPSYRESYDAAAEIQLILGPTEIIPSLDPCAHEQFGGLFDLSKSEEELSLISDSITAQYIRATSEDYESLFQNCNDFEELK